MCTAFPSYFLCILMAGGNITYTVTCKSNLLHMFWFQNFSMKDTWLFRGKSVTVYTVSGFRSDGFCANIFSDAVTFDKVGAI